MIHIHHQSNPIVHYNEFFFQTNTTIITSVDFSVLLQSFKDPKKASWCWNMNPNICPCPKSPSCVGEYIYHPWSIWGYDEICGWQHQHPGIIGPSGIIGDHRSVTEVSPKCHLHQLALARQVQCCLRLGTIRLRAPEPMFGWKKKQLCIWYQKLCIYIIWYISNSDQQHVNSKLYSILM